jgi:hypothetical protein
MSGSWLHEITACGEGDPPGASGYSLASEEAVAPRADAHGQLDWTVASVVPRAIARRELGARLGGVVLGLVYVLLSSASLGLRQGHCGSLKA